MALAPWVLGAQIVGGMLQARAGEKALQEQMAWLQQFYAPEMAARQQLMTRLGKESPLLAAQHTRRERQIRESAEARGAVERAIGRRTGVARTGALGRIEAEKEEALSQEALSYGERQQAEIDKVINSLLGRGEAGPAISGVLGKMGEMETGVYGQIGEALGTYAESLRPTAGAGVEEAPAGMGRELYPTVTPSARPTLAPVPAPAKPLVPPHLPVTSPPGAATTPSPFEEEDVLGILDASEMSGIRLPWGGRRRVNVRFGRGLRPARV